MEIKVIKNKISLAEVKVMADQSYGDMVKAVIDVEQETIAIGGEFHADAEEKLLKNGSQQMDLWGINLYPEKSGAEFIEYTSLINIRPKDGNRQLEIGLPEIRKKIENIVKKIITEK